MSFEVVTGAVVPTAPAAAVPEIAAVPEQTVPAIVAGVVKRPGR